MRRLFAAIRNLFRGRRADRDLDAELANYLAFAVDDYERRGLSRAEAERAARLDFGGKAQVTEAVRDARSGQSLATLGRDCTYSVRVLWKTPGFSLAVIGVLALGIGANTAIFSLVNGVLLKPLPFADATRLVRLFQVPPPKVFPGVTRFSVSPANFLDWKRQAHAFEEMAIYQVFNSTLNGTSRAETVLVASMSPEVFSILRVQPAMGRVFRPEEQQPGHSQVAVVSQSWWREHFPDEARLDGQTLTLDHQTYAIVGVRPASAEWPAFGLTSAAIWVPLAWDDAERAVRGNHNYQVVARLKPDADIAQASSEMNHVSSQLEQQYPKDNAGWGATVIPLRELVVGGVRQSLLVLFGAVWFVLLIAAANAANLILGRALGRRKELAIRAALGASRPRIIRQIVVEAVLLSLAAGLVGAGLSQLSLSLVSSFLADQLPRADEISLDGRVLAFTIAISFMTGLAASLVPALRASRTSLHDTLKQGVGRTDAHSTRRRGRRLLVTAEVALSLMLLVGAGLMIRSVWALTHVDPGFDPTGVTTVALGIPTEKYTTPAQRSRFFDDTLSRVRAIPGVTSAAVIDSLPLSGGSMQPITIEGRAVSGPADQPEVNVRQSSVDYLKTLRIPLIAGRDISAQDAHAVLVSESAVKSLWPGENPIGRRIQFPFSPGASWEIVGIVGDIPPAGLDSNVSKAMIYQWAQERPWTRLTLVVRTDTGLPDPGPSVLRIVHDMDPDLAVPGVTTLESLVTASTASQRFTAEVFTMFAGIALLLAGFGMYSVLAYAVRSRAREIGIRTALGASRRQVLRTVFAEGMLPVVLGLTIGLVGAAWLGPLLRSLVFGVRTSDPLTLGSVAILLAAVACLASAIPAYRAARVDPLTVLRDE